MVKPGENIPKFDNREEYVETFLKHVRRTIRVSERFLFNVAHLKLNVMF